MKQLAWFFAFLCITATADAQHIRDMSLTPAETRREPDNAPNITDVTKEYLGGGGVDRNRGAINYYATQQRTPQKSLFMDEYCSPSIQPIINSAHLKGLMECVESVKKRACDGFARLPEEAKEPVDNAAQCVFRVAQSGTGPSYAVQCRDSYAQQLALLKKYWDDQSTAYTILFLPDMLVGSNSFCQDRPL